MRKHRPGNAVEVDRHQKAREEQAEYTMGFMHHLTETVTAMLDDEQNILIPTPDTLDWHVQLTPSYLQAAYEELGALEKMLRMARHNRDQVKATVKGEKIRDCERRDVRVPAEHILMSEVILDPRVTATEEEMAEIEAQIKVVEGSIAAINMKASFLPGLQGAKNRTMPTNYDEPKKRKDR